MSSEPPQPAVGVTSDRLAAVSPTARAVHRAILRGFATTGHAPNRTALTAAVPPGENPDALLTELHNRDVVRLDEHGRVRAAYPFSATPTTHVVTIEDGPTVYAMCAIDALGIADMLRTRTTIRSTDPGTGKPVQVNVHNGQATWEPATAVVVTGAYTSTGGGCPAEDADACTAPAAERCCGVMNIFTDPGSAHAWLAAHPHVSGTVLNQPQALRMGADIFGRLLDE
jgi:hypothetical protein